jgi:RNA recognition motif-containing protein
MAKNLYVSNLSYGVDTQQLQEIFETYGDIQSAKVIMDRETGRSRGFGFVEMSNDAEARNAINSLNDSELDGRTIVVKVAEPKGDRPQRRERY